MAKINLLPWRSELHRKKQQEFVQALGAGVVTTVFLFALVYLYIEDMHDRQQRRIQMLDNEILIADRKIGKVRDIEAKIDKIQEKIELIEALQGSRPQIIHVFDELAKNTPRGIYLTKITQLGNKFTLSGTASSNASVSAYMRAIKASEWLRSPLLEFSKDQSNVIKDQDNAASGKQIDFTMSVKQKSG